MKIIEKIKAFYATAGEAPVVELEAVETWGVYWWVNLDSGSFVNIHYGKQVAQFFPERKTAEAFADNLRKANELIGNEYKTDITVKKQSNGL